jgi:hypothetical protein
MGWVMSRHLRGEGEIVKAYAKGQAWRASVRDTRHNEVVVAKRATAKKSRKKRKKKDPLLESTFFLEKSLHFDPNFRPFPEGTKT